MLVKQGEQVQYTIVGHSALNGANIPEGSTVTVEGNNDAVAVAPTDVVVPAGGTQKIPLAVTILGPGTVDWHTTVTDPAGEVFEATDTLMVVPVEPGLASITATFETLLEINPLAKK